MAILCLAAFKARISRLTSRAGQSALETVTPSRPSSDRGAHFRCCVLQGCKKSARMKLLVLNTFGDNTLSIIQTNCNIKATTTTSQTVYSDFLAFYTILFF